MMKIVGLVLIAAVSGVLSLGNIQEYVEHIEKLALDESIVTEQTDFLDRRERLLDEKANPNGNNYLGAPHFSCPTMGARSPKAPSSVHAVRLNDIAAMGALGDSLTAGLGAGAHSLLELPLDYRGLSFTIGGDSDLMYSATLPNMVNQFSANVVGASTRVAPVWFEYFSNFNVAVSGAKAGNMTEQAEELIRRMKESEHFDALNEYKLITVFIGTNDLCDHCQDKTMYSAESYKSNVDAAVSKLRAALPKTIVSLVSPVHVELLRLMNKESPYCVELHKATCPCLSSDDGLTNLVKDYQQALHEVAAKYEDDDDFAVVVQTSSEKQSMPFDSTGAPDYSFFAPDCFHFSHYGHALLAKALFTNMLEPVGQKATKYDLARLEPACPTPECPFIRTAGNSKSGACSKLATKSEPLIKGPMSFKKNVPEDTVLAASPSSTNAPYIPVVVRDEGTSTALVLVGLTLGLIFGLIIGTLSYHILQIKRREGRFIMPSENTPLLSARGKNYNSEDNNYVQIY